MRRFSQRSSLVTLSEINITPLLDLAFVLLIIFIITTPLLEQSIDLKLPSGGRPDKAGRRFVRTIEITPTGVFTLNRQRMALEDIEAALVRDYKSNTNLIIDIRADENTRARDIYAVMDRCQRNGLLKWSLRTQPEGGRK
jgi:biopolymer transport protein ExbD